MPDEPSPFVGGDAELALRLLELAPYVAMLVDGAAIVRWVSGSALATTGYRADEIVGHNVIEFIDTTWNPIALESVGAALTREGLQRAMVFRLLRKDGSTFMIDLDRFKPVNDSLGHGAGDQVLRAAAGRLLAAVRSGDLVALLGGDEFAVVCESVEAGTLGVIASRIAASIANPFAVGDERVTIGASVGIAHASPGSCSIDLLMDAADAALYAVKAAGRGGWCVGELS